MSNKKPLIAIAALALVAAVLVWRSLAERASTDELTLYGNVDIREVELAFRVPGRLLEMDFDEGDAVTAGQQIARLDPETYVEALAVADARVEQSRAMLEKLESGTRPQEVQRARDAVRAAQAQFDNARSDFERQTGLAASGASSQRIVDAARARRDAADAELSAAREALALAEEGFRDEDIASARADLAAASAQREQAQTQVDDTELVAPSDGILIARLREPGSMLMQGAPVYSLSLREPIYVRAYAAEPDLGHVAPGTAVTVTTDSSDTVYRGQIGFVAPRAEFTPKTVQTTDLRTDLVFRLRIVIENGDDGLLQGMPVTIHVPRAADRA
jgi:HlyD family secretion protein